MLVLMNTVELILTIRLKQALEVTLDPGTSGRKIIVLQHSALPDVPNFGWLLPRIP
jgi:hypothetical protein